MNHWAMQYIGTKWVNGGRDIAIGVDCWGLLQHVYRQHYVIELPSFVGVDAKDNMAVARLIGEREQWQEIKTPIEGCAVAMSKNKALHHVGVFVCGMVLHAVEGIGVIAQSTAALRNNGWTTVRFFKHGAMA